MAEPGGEAPETPVSCARMLRRHLPRPSADLEVQVQDIVLVQVMHTLTDLLGEQDHIQFSQVVLLIRDPVKEFTSIHTAGEREEAGVKPSKALRGPESSQSRCAESVTACRMPKAGYKGS